MKNLGMRKLSVLASVVCLLVFFQNCSDIQSSVLNKGQEKAAGSGDANAPGDIIIADQPPGQETPPSGPSDDDQDHEPDQRTPSSGSGETCQHDSDRTPSSSESEGEGAEEEVKVDFSEACKDLKMFGIKNILVDATNVEGVHGQVMVKSDQIDLIQDHSSVLIVTGHTSVAMVKNIVNVRGQTIICNAVVDRIEHVRGKLILVDSIVNELVDQRGRLVSIRSKIKNQVGK